MTAEEIERREARRLHRAERLEQQESLGLFESIRRILQTTLAMFESRVELIALELRVEKKRTVSLVGWGIALVFLCFMTGTALMGIVVFLFWEKALAVLLGFCAFFLVLAVCSFFVARSHLEKIPFEETVAQFKKDRESMSGEWVPWEPDL